MLYMLSKLSTFNTANNNGTAGSSSAGSSSNLEGYFWYPNGFKLGSFQFYRRKKRPPQKVQL